MKKCLVCKFEKRMRHLGEQMNGRLIQSFIATAILLQCICSNPTYGQMRLLPPSDTYRPDRLKKVVLSESLIFVATSVGLYYLWYRKYPKSRFHFIRDGREWLQMDKIGHATTAYTISNMHYDLMRWSGVNDRSSINTSIITSLAYLSIIEIMDGFSKGWGFSGGDMLANLSGAALFAGQQYAWGEQRVSMKFSARLTPFAEQNPRLLGKNFASRIMKDYNGQTYWLSANIRSFLPGSSQFPPWVNLAVGYGGEGMLRANKSDQQFAMNMNHTTRYRQWYLAPDIDVSRINANKEWSTPLYLTQFLKTPAPAIEWNSKRKFKLHPIHY